MQKVLIFGGSQFIGRNLVEQLIADGGYDIWLFNRQISGADLFPNLNKIKGDRYTDDVKQIAHQNWDYVIDLSAYFPNSVTEILKQLGRVKKYILISSCSAYQVDDPSQTLKGEEAPLLACTAEEAISEDLSTYGARKAECERRLKEADQDYLILRPALVYGQYDLTDRLYYWLYQTYHKSEFLIPEQGRRNFSSTYVMDLVQVIMLGLKHEKFCGSYNVTTTAQNSIGEIIRLAMRELNQKPDLVNASASFLHEREMAQWTDIPLWIEGDHFTFSNEKIKSSIDFKASSLAKSIKETIAYYAQLNWPAPKYGITDEVHSDLVQSLKNEQA